MGRASDEEPAFGLAFCSGGLIPPAFCFFAGLVEFFPFLNRSVVHSVIPNPATLFVGGVRNLLFVSLEYGLS
jgi:hypothetical protein